jgi:DNA-binding NarL/FixJ family response regulator
MGGEVMSVSLLIAVSNALACDLLCRAFNQRRRQFKVVASVCTRKDLFQQVEAHHPDSVLLSANLENKPTGGLQALRELSLTHPSARVIVLLDCSDPEQVVDAFSHGARGVFCRSENFPALCKCVRSVYAGQVWADSSQMRWVVRALEKKGMIHIISAKGAPLLSKREEQIVRMIAEGLPNSEIHAALGLSPHTVKNHLFNIYNKLGISTRAELQLYALASRDAAKGGDDLSK